MIWEYELDAPQFQSKSYRRNEISDVNGVDCSMSEDMAKQEFKEEVDINTLVRRFNLTGELPQGVRMPEYGDFTGISDYHTAMNVIQEAHSAFALMPAEIRERFRNDPGEFVAFCENPANLAEARAMGLVPEAELRAMEEAESVGGKEPASAGSTPPPDSGNSNG